MDSLHGFIHGELDIKILILYILRRLYTPVSLDELHELSMCDSGITFFDFADCVADLVSTGHVEEYEGRYSITEKGAKNGVVTENNIPVSVRQKADQAVKAAVDLQKRNSMISTSFVPQNSGGFDVSLSLKDSGGKILSIDILAGTPEQAKLMQQSFRRDAENIYRKIVRILLNWDDSIIM